MDNWIKIKKDLPDKPEVMHIADALDISEYQVVGHLVAFWSWIDSNLSRECPEFSGTFRGLDRIAGKEGFTKALVSAGWLIHNDGIFRIPNFDRHLDKSAKTREHEKERKRKIRNLQKLSQENVGQNRDNVPELSQENVGQNEGQNRDKTGTSLYIEKRREDIIEIDKSISSPTNAKAFWSETTGFVIPENVLLRFREAFPACDIESQAARASEWLVANPRKRKKDTHRFLCAWLSRAQERGGDIAANRPAQNGFCKIAVPVPAINGRISEPQGWREALLDEAAPGTEVPENWQDLSRSVQRYALDLCARREA